VNPLASVAGKILPKSVVQRLSASNAEDVITNKLAEQNDCHQRLFELHSLEKKRRDKNEAIRISNIRKEESKCTFQPKISKGSKVMTRRPQTASTPSNKIIVKRSKSPSIFDKLHDDSKKSPSKEKTRQQIEDDKYFEECTFKPDIK
jgi:hypothetical protein